MAWTSPMTFADNAVLTAAQLNAHLRDNLNETAPAKATTAGGIFVATGMNAITQRIPTGATVLAAQSTTLTTYTDLSTAGPAVTVTTGTKAIVHLYAALSNASTNSASLASYAVTGATSLAASDNRAIEIDGSSGGAANDVRSGASWLVENLTAGSNTFTMKYRAGSSTATFSARHIYVIPL